MVPFASFLSGCFFLLPLPSPHPCIWVLSDAFSILVDNIMFVFSSSNMYYIGLKLNIFVFFLINPTWSWYMTFLVYCQLVRTLLKIFETGSHETQVGLRFMYRRMTLTSDLSASASQCWDYDVCYEA